MKARPAARSFTLIELMCASTLLSVILLMMVGMQDQMSKAWKNSNRRMDATREARAALRMMSSDLGNLFFRTNTDGSTMAYNPNESPVPMAILNDAARKLTLPNMNNVQTGSVAGKLACQNAAPVQTQPLQLMGRASWQSCVTV